MSRVYERSYGVEKAEKDERKGKRDGYPGAVRKDRNEDELQRWTRPDSRVIKINFDAGVDVRSRTGGAEVAVRDSSGRFFAARSITLVGIVDPLIAEALAAREGLLFAVSWDWKVIQL
ncbi:hypothetical protein RHMOL_Rhmol09G0129000 [Rhododendron molle]|uniref:Uncharacterized protein n=1 Tax=Rhododendron molle TaxID=49168 RepID=A0ACC0MCS7_RHOML|nr:hypothetical protein RHMOL_Rhmol09G0129000 [Rhododendron molle]